MVALVDLVELLDVDELDELEDVVDVDDVELVGDVVVLGAVGVNVVCPTLKPSAAASVPLPEIVMSAVLFRAVMTSWPLLLSEAVTCALVERLTLSALIRSPTVSVPVDV